MLKRIGLFTVSLVLLFTAIPLSLAESDCDYSYSNHARAAQLHAMGDLTGALPYYECALDADPDNHILRNIVNDLHHSNDVTIADDTCPTDVNHLEVGFNLRGRGELTDALYHLECALQESPYDTALWMTIGNIHGELGDSQLAQTYFNRSGTGLIYTDTSRLATVTSSVCADNINHYEYGVALRAEGDFETALTHLTCALETNPTDPALLMMIGNVYGNMGDLRTANYYFDRSGTGAVFYETSQMQLNLCDSTVSYHAKGAQLYAMGDRQGAISAFECALLSNSDNYSVMVQLAQVYIDTEDYDLALHYLTDAMTVDNWNAQIHSMRGYVNYKLQRYQVALNDVDYALRINADYPSALETRELILQAMGRDSGEFVQVDDCDNSMSQFALASQRHAMGDLIRAMEAYHCALNHNPENTAIMIQLAQVYTDMEEYDQAIRYLDRALELDARNIAYLSQRGYVHYLAGEMTLGLADVQLALRWNPDYTPALETRDLILNATAGDTIASADITNAPAATPPPSNAGKDSLPQLDDSTVLTTDTSAELEATSPTADTLRTAAHAFVGQGRYDLAIEQYEALLGFEPNNPQVHFSIGHAYYALENFGIALSYLEQAIDLNPDDMYTSYYLSMAHSQLNNRGEALAILDEMYTSGWTDGAFPLVMGHVYHNLGYPEVAGIKFYEWMTDRETLRLPAELTIDNDTDVIMDYGLMYEIPFMATAGEIVHISVTSHILNPAPIDPLIVVLNADGIPIAGDDDDGALFDSSLHFMPPSSGDYTLIVSHAGGKHAGELDVQLTGNVWSAQSYRDFAQTAFADQDYELAIDLLNRAIAIDGGIANDYAQLARIYTLMGDLDSAAVMLSQGLELDPLRNDMRCDLGSIYATWGDIDAALQAFDTVLANDPTNSCATNNRDSLMMQARGEASDAIAVVTIVEAPLSPADDLYELGLEHKANRRTFSAANTFLQATVVDPTHAAARCELAQIQLKWGNYHGTLRNIETLLNANPNDPCALDLQIATAEKTGRIFVPLTSDDFLNLGMSYYNSGDLENAIKSLATAVELNPQDNVSRCYLGIAHMDVGNYDEALRQWDIILNQNLNYPDSCAWSNSRSLRRHLRNMDTDTTDNSAATVTAESPVTYAPSPADDLYEEGMQKLADNKLFGASDAFIRAIIIDPDHMRARCELARIDLQWGNYYHAAQAYHIILDANPNDPCGLEVRLEHMTKRNQMYIPTSIEDFVVRGNRYYEIAEYDLAIESYQTAIKLDPQRNDVRCKLGVAYADSGNHQEALNQWDIILNQEVMNSCARSNRDALMQALRTAETDTSASYGMSEFGTQDADVFIAQGDQFVAMEEWDSAIDAYLTALEIEPSLYNLRCRVGMIYVDLGDYDNAIEQFNRVISQDISNICANNQVRNVYRILREAPSDAMTAEDYISEGDDYLAQFQLEHAIDSYLAALHLDPTRHDLRCQVGTLYIDLQQIDRAQSEFLTILSYDSNNTCARNQIHNISEWMYYRLPELTTSSTAQITDVDELYEIALSMGVRSLFHEAQIRHDNGDVWTASALLDRYIDDNFTTSCAGELRWLADEYELQGFTVMADMMRLKAIGDSTC